MIAIITELIGYSAAVVGTLLMLPQVIKSIKTKKLMIFHLQCLFFIFLTVYYGPHMDF